jgi:hypothetical protein
MAFEALEAVRLYSRASGTRLAVLMELANRVNQDRLDAGYEMEAWPGITWLAEACNVSRRSVRRALSELVGNGEIEEHERRGGKANKPGSRTFVITLDHLPPKPKLPPESRQVAESAGDGNWPDSADALATSGHALATSGQQVGQIRPHNQKGTVRTRNGSGPTSGEVGALSHSGIERNGTGDYEPDDLAHLLAGGDGT